MIDVNVPVTNENLVNVLNKFFDDKTPENEIELINQIQLAHFLTPMIFEGEIENNVIKKDSLMKLKLLTNTSGDTYFMAFTDWAELGKWSSEKEETLILTYDDLSFMIQDDKVNIKGFVINPFSHNLIITPEIINYFSQRKSEVIIQKKTEVILGVPENYPTEMVEEIISFLHKKKEVDSAYIFLAKYDDNSKPNFLIVIDSSNGKEYFPQVGSIAQKYIGQEDYVDIIPLNSDFGRSSIINATPFYKRKKWKLFNN